MIDRIQLPLRFDLPPLRQELEKLEQLDWIDHFVQQNYDGLWSVIPLRGPAGAEHPVMMIYSDPACSEFTDTPFLEHCPAIRQLLATFQCPLQAVRLMKLGAGSSIKEHCDHDLSAEDGTARLHIPITTNPQVAFFLNGSRVDMAPGSCWYLRLSDPHSVENNGTTDRVHLVIDALVNDWLRNQLQ